MVGEPFFDFIHSISPIAGKYDVKPERQGPDRAALVDKSRRKTLDEWAMKFGIGRCRALAVSTFAHE
jgi:hypothetical protein